ncbi:MAG: ParB/RepB/Spo0J family partition protein [Alphaproteobacteria bacterium]|nr:ParB/RepB/Spo0J family partition protein [Alphaproteobacteria bacterium]
MTTKPASKPAPLGRGLSALFGDSDTAYQPRPIAVTAIDAAEKDKPGTAQLMLPVERIQPGAFQPRRRFDEDAIKGLADSIRERGVVQPLMVRPVEGQKDSYEIIAGERRWRAAQQAGLHEVPVLIRTLSDREALEIGLIENVQRQDLSPLEEAEGYRRLMEEFQHSQDGLAKVVGKSRPHITNMLRLLTLPTAVKQMIDGGQLTMGHARALITAKNPLSLAEEIVKKGMSVRQAEALAKRESDGRFAKKKKTAASIAPDANIAALEKEMENALGLKVKISADAKTGFTTGSVTVHYSSLEQLDGVIRKLRA